MSTLDDHVRRFRARFAIKVTLAAVVCALISFFFHLSMGYLSPVIVVLTFVAFRDQVATAGILAYVPVLIAGAVSLVLCGVLVEARMALVLCMLGWLFLWMAFLVKIPLGRILGGILIAMALMTVAVASGRPEDLVLGFWTQVFIGTVAAIAFDRLLWPANATDAAYETLAAVFADFAGVAEALNERLRARNPDQPERLVDLSDIANVSGLLRHTVGGTSEAEFQLKFRLWLIRERAQVLQRQVHRGAFAALPDPFVSDFAEIIADFARHFRELAEAALQQRPAETIGDDTRHRVENLVASSRDAGLRETGTSDASLLATTLIKFTRHAMADHMRLVEAYNAVAESGFVPSARPDGARFSMADLFAWPTVDDYKTSAKTTLIVLLLMLGVLYLDFPGGVLVAFYGILFGLTVNLGQLYMKGGTGVLGVVAGLAYGVIGVFIVAQSPHFPILLGLFGLGIFLSVHVASGKESLTFMGLQAALLIPYVFLIFDGPEWTLSDALTRAAALAVSAVVALVVQGWIWPVDPLLMFKRATAQALDAIATSWRHLWVTGGSGASGTAASAPEFPEALIRSFCQPAAWLRDSRYLVGSGHVAADRYARVLGYLEELLAELSLLDRLLRSSKDGALRERANVQLEDAIVTIAKALEALASFYRDPRSVDQLVDLRAPLARLPSVLSGQVVFDDLEAAEERRTASVLLHTIADLAGSLASTVDATVELSSVKRRGRAPVPARPRLLRASR